VRAKCGTAVGVALAKNTAVTIPQPATKSAANGIGSRRPSNGRIGAPVNTDVVGARRRSGERTVEIITMGGAIPARVLVAEARSTATT